MDLLPVISWHKYLYCFMWFLQYHSASFQPKLLCSSRNFITTFFLNLLIFKNHLKRRVSCNINLGNPGNVLHRNLRTNRARECIFRSFGSTNFKKSTAQHQSCLHVCRFNQCMYQSATYTEIFLGDQFQQKVFFGGGEGERNCDAPLRVQGKGVVGTRWQSSQKLQGFSTQKSLTFD